MQKNQNSNICKFGVHTFCQYIIWCMTLICNAWKRNYDSVSLGINIKNCIYNQVISRNFHIVPRCIRQCISFKNEARDYLAVNICINSKTPLTQNDKLEWKKTWGWHIVQLILVHISKRDIICDTVCQLRCDQISIDGPLYIGIRSHTASKSWTHDDLKVSRT